MAEESEKKDWLQKAEDFGVPKGLINVCRSAGPLLVAQSDKLSEAYAKHQARLAEVAIWKEMMLEEVRTLSRIRGELLEKYYKTHDPSERLRLKRDLEELRGDVRQVKTAAKALGHLPADAKGSATISEHWTDKFNQLVRAANEPWREELLARALAAEAVAPGTIVPRALWLLGTAEKSVFDALSTLIDLALLVRGSLIIPEWRSFITKPIPGREDGVAISGLLYQLSEVGLVAEFDKSYRLLRKGGRHRVKYYDLEAELHCENADHQGWGIVLTTIGNSLASFSEPKENPMGREIYESFLKSLDGGPCKVHRLSGGN
jgi:hypothetical protein